MWRPDSGASLAQIIPRTPASGKRPDQNGGAGAKGLIDRETAARTAKTLSDPPPMLADWIALVRQFPGGDLCVLGDLNQDLSRRDYYGSRANRTALLDALRTVGLSALTADPTDPVRAVARDRASIDHICVTARVVQQGSARLEVWPSGAAPDRRLSDHYGVAADLGSRRPVSLDEPEVPPAARHTPNASGRRQTEARAGQPR